jgi:hypothetical protein
MKENVDIEGVLLPRLGHDVRHVVASHYIRCEHKVQIPVHCGQSFRRIADSIPVIADSF